MRVSLKYAQEHLSDLVSAANRGEEVEIAAPNQSPVRLTLVISNEAKQDVALQPRPLGRLRGLIQVPTDEEWAAMDKEFEEMMSTHRSPRMVISDLHARFERPHLGARRA